MVANASSYRPPVVPPFFDSSDPVKAIKLLRQTIQRGIEVAFVPRGQDKAFCEFVTDEALLTIHAEIDAYCERVDFGIWAMAIAVRFGFETLRKQKIVKRNKDQTGLDSSQNRRRDSLERVLELEYTDAYGEIAKCLLDTHRTMVRRLLAGENPVALSFDMDLDADFVDLFLDEAVRKRNRLNDQLIHATGCQLART